MGIRNVTTFILASAMLTLTPAGTAPAAGPMRIEKSIEVSSAKVNLGRSFQLQGTLISGAGRRQKIRVERRNNGRWVMFKRAYANKSGRYNVRVWPKREGASRYRVVGEQSKSARLPRVATRAVRVTVLPRRGRTLSNPAQAPWYFAAEHWSGHVKRATVSKDGPDYRVPPIEEEGWVYVVAEAGSWKIDERWAYSDIIMSDFIGNDGVTYSEWTPNAPGNCNDFPTILWEHLRYPGQNSYEGYICAQVREEAVEGGIWELHLGGVTRYVKAF